MPISERKKSRFLIQSVVEVYNNQTRIELHPRSHKACHYVTQKELMPVNQTYNADCSSDYFITSTQKIGTYTKRPSKKY